jgi:hypothetical protein
MYTLASECGRLEIEGDRVIIHELEDPIVKKRGLYIGFGHEIAFVADDE